MKPALKTRSDSDLRALLHVLVASGGTGADVHLRRELLDTGFVRPDCVRDEMLHLTPEGRRFLYEGAASALKTSGPRVA
jgi:hypothetical protein